MQRWLIKVPFTAIFRPGIIIKLMVVEDRGGEAGGGELGLISLRHQFHPPVTSSPLVWAQTHWWRTSREGCWLSEGVNQSMIWEVLLITPSGECWRGHGSLPKRSRCVLWRLYLWSDSERRNFWTESGLSFLLPQAQQFKDWQTELCRISIWKVALAFYGGMGFSQSVRVSAPTERRATRCRGRLGSEAESCWHKLAFSWLWTTEGTRRQTSSREELRPALSGRLTVSVWVRGQIWLRRFERKPEPLRSWV